MDLLTSEFRVGDCLIEPRELRLTRAGEVIRLEPRVLQVLLALARRAGATVTRDELLAEAWDGQIVTDDAINRAIWKLRAALSSDPRGDPAIETVPRRGYRLRREVRAGRVDAATDTARPTAIDSEAIVESDASHAPSPAATEARATLRPRSHWRAFALVALLALGLVAVWLARTPSPPASALPELRPLTNLPYSETLPSFSPDGRRLVFSALSESGEQLWIQDIAGATPTPLTSGAYFDRSPAWSAVGDRIAFVRIDGDRCTVNLMAVSGGEPRALTECRAEAWPSLSLAPDGRRLVLSDRPDPAANGQSLYLVDIDSGERRVLTDAPAGQGDLRPSWSPDGRWIAFLRLQGRRVRELMRVSADGGAPETLTAEHGLIQSVAWRDAQRLLFLRAEHSVIDLWQLDLSGEKPARPRSLGVTRVGDGGLAVSPDGRVVALAISQTPHAIWRYPNPRMAAADEVPQRLLQSSRADRDPRYSPDGRQLAFVSTRSGGLALWLAQADGSEASVLWSATDSEASDLDWAPDGQRIVFERSARGKSKLCVISLDRRLSCPTGMPDSAIMPSWSRDGAWLYYSATADGDWRIWRMRPDGSDPQIVQTDRAYAAHESADGRRLLFARVGEDGLWSRDLGSGEVRLLAADLPASRPRAHTSDEHGAYYVNGRSEIAYVPFDGGEPQVLHAMQERFPNSTLSLSPDRSSFVFSLAGFEVGDIELLTNLDQVAPRE